VHQYLLTRGVAIFDFNYRGSTGYGKTFARLNDRRLRENELQDLRDAVAWLKTQPRVDGRRVAIMGGSYGGYLTMAAMARLPELFASGVAFVGVANWVTALEGASPQLKASDGLEYGDIDNPEDRAFFTRISPITHVKDVKAPVMVLHGANDPRDPVTESDQYVRGIRRMAGRSSTCGSRTKGTASGSCPIRSSPIAGSQRSWSARCRPLSPDGRGVVHPAQWLRIRESCGVH
jgi:dipeptidyl aminopeptidase/acylaminoacyl peptidase